MYLAPIHVFTTLQMTKYNELFCLLIFYTHLSSSKPRTYFIFFLKMHYLCVFMHACMIWEDGCYGVHMEIRGQLWNQFASSTFKWILGIEFRSSGHLVNPTLIYLLISSDFLKKGQQSQVSSNTKYL